MHWEINESIQKTYHSNGTLKRQKAQLVVFGNHKIKGLDYNETFASVAKSATICDFLAIATVKKFGTPPDGCTQRHPSCGSR